MNSFIKGWDNVFPFVMELLGAFAAVIIIPFILFIIGFIIFRIAIYLDSKELG